MASTPGLGQAHPWALHFSTLYAHPVSQVHPNLAQATEIPVPTIGWKAQMCFPSMASNQRTAHQLQR